MKRQKQITLTLLTVYLIILSWIILFKLTFSFEDLKYLYRPRSINLIPFGQSVFVNGKLYLSEIINNLIVFIPIGVYVELLLPDWSFFKKACIPFGISFAYEIIQLTFAIGATDMTDLITNTSGGIIGIFICLVLRKLLKDKVNKFVNIVASMCTIILIILVATLIITNL